MKMTPLVRISLMALRIYLLILLTLIIVSFARVLKSGKSETDPTASRQAITTRAAEPMPVSRKKNAATGSLPGKPPPL
jgi:hypothetical protein